MAKAIAILAVTAALALVACGGDDEDEGSAATETTAAEETTPPEETTQAGGQGGGGARDGGGGGGKSKPKPGIEITTAGSQFGEVLFDADQRAIYYFDKESGPRSECYGDCAAAWPPVLTEGEPQAGGEIEKGLLGTTERDDGTTQVTYDDRPLYYYVDDPAGEVLCHNVAEFGGLWLAVQPSGAPVP